MNRKELFKLFIAALFITSGSIALPKVSKIYTEKLENELVMKEAAAPDDKDGVTVFIPNPIHVQQFPPDYYTLIIRLNIEFTKIKIS
jgi:hypothetical protein